MAVMHLYYCERCKNSQYHKLVAGVIMPNNKWYCATCNTEYGTTPIMEKSKKDTDKLGETLSWAAMQ